MGDPSHSLALAVIIIFATLSLPTAFVSYRHGVRGLAILGWGYLFVFCSLKIIGSGLQLADPQSAGASIVNNIGLSPLLLATAGVLHEAQFYHASASKRRADESKELAATGLFHMFIILGLALVAAGTSKISKAETPDDTETAWTISRVGGAVLLAGWVAIVALAAQSCMAGHLVTLNQARRKDSALLLMAVLAALPFLGVRVIGMFAYLVSKDQSLSAGAGSIGIKVGLYVFHEIVVTLVLVVAGVISRRIPQQPDDEGALNTASGYIPVQPPVGDTSYTGYPGRFENSSA